jgi:hypothetical protein
MGASSSSGSSYNSDANPLNPVNSAGFGTSAASVASVTAAYNAAAVGLDRKENEWLQDIWQEILTSDLGYHRMPLDDVSDTRKFVHLLWHNL